MSESTGPETPDESAPSNHTDKIRELEETAKDQENKYLYLYAEFENFKKRAVKERSDLMKFGWERVARDLLLVLDNIDRALQHVPPDTDENFLNGLKLVQQQFLGALTKQGVERIAAENTVFDPNLHEALGQVPSSQPPGTVVKEEIPGYTLHGRLLRPARVLISGGKGNGAEGGNAQDEGN